VAAGGLGRTHDRPHAFDWSRESVPEDWQQVAGWHRGVSASTGIRPPDDDDAAIDAQFAEAGAATPRLGELLAHHLPFYRKLQAWTLPHGDARGGRDARMAT
jgi:hypothetical protein